MPFQIKYIGEIDKISELVRNNNLEGQEGAFEKFKLYVQEVQEIGRYDPKNWQFGFTNAVYNFGRLFKSANPSFFLNLIDEKLKDQSIANREVLEFIRSEIAINFGFDGETLDGEVQKYLETLCKEYPYNAEFRNNLGHSYVVNKNYLQAIELYKAALNLYPSNSAFTRSLFTSEFEYLNSLITKGDTLNAKSYWDKIMNSGFYLKQPVELGGINYVNKLYEVGLRIDDHIAFQQRLKILESDFKSKMTTELENERRRIVEVLGFFSGIIAFILSTVSIGKNFNFTQAIYFVISLGIVLILFTSSISVMLTENKGKYYKSPTFWLLTVGLIMTLLLILTTDNIATIVGNIRPKDD